MRNSRWSTLLGAALLAGVVTSCDDPTRPPTVGEIAPRIAFIQPDSVTRASLVLPLTGVRARAIGPTGKVVDLVLQGSTWRGSLTGLSAGTYEVILEGIANNQVQFYGRIPTITLARGERAQPFMPFAAAVPTVANPTLNNTTNFSQRIPFATIEAATGYRIEISQDNTFASGVTQFTASDTNPLVTVTQPGTWYIRSAAILPQVANTSIPWSDTRSWIVIEANGGDDANDATPVPLIPEDPQTVTARNLTPTKREDWFDVDLREGDSLFVETFAARLTLPSTLNTTLTLFEQDGTTQVAQNLDAPSTTDSRLVYVAENTDTYKVRVGATGTTSGHYELTTEIRRLPEAPTGLTATILSGTSVRLDWSDEADNETSFRVERCEGAACSNFAEVTTAATDAETLTEAGLTQGTTYRWRVRARNNVGNSIYTSEVTAALVGPAAPTGVSATTISNTQINVNWTDAATNETGYEVERCTGAACSDFVQLTTLAAGATTFADMTAAYNTTYRYQVRATNNVVPSAYSTIVSAHTIPPTTPTGLTATVAGPTTINLAWTDASSDETFFLIERCQGDGCSGFAVIDSVGAGVSAYASTVVYNTAYRFRIRARSAVISQSTSTVADADTRPPTAPTALSATTQSATAIALLWNDNSDDETGFRIERCDVAACTNFALLTTVGVDIEGYTDNTATVGNTYRYRVIAVGVPGNSAETNVADANTIVPAAPTSLAAATITASVIRLTWSDNADNETGYRLDRCAGAACTPTVQVAAFAAGVTQFDDSTAVAGTNYSYRLYATNIAGLSATSNTASANTNPPATPTAFTATLINGSQIDLAWTVSDGSTTGVRVERCDGVGCSDFAEIEFVVGAGESFSDVTVTPGNVYSYRLRAQNAADVSGYTAVQTVSTEYAAAPTGVTAVALDVSNIQLNWTVSAGPGATQVEISRCDGVGCVDFALLTTVSAAATSYVDNTTVADVVYRYRLAAVNLVGTGTASAIAEAETAVPDAPTGLAASVGYGKVALTWTDASNDETAFHVYRCTGDPCGPFSPLTQLAPNVVSYNDLTAVANESYSYYVVAVNAIGETNSALATATTALVVSPTIVSATSTGPTSIQVDWTDATLSETGFVIGRCAGVGCTVTTFSDTVAANVQTFADATVSAEQSYTYQVAALAPFGASAATTSATATTFLPATPTDFVATTLSSSVVRLSWTDVATDETEYRVGYCAGVACVPSDTVKLIAPANAVLVDVTGLDANETYTFRLWAFRAAGISASVTAVAATNIPAIPSNFGANVTTPTEVFVVWTDVADETGYEIEICTGGGCTDFVPLALPAADAVAYGVSLTNGVTYRFRMRASSAAGSSAFTDPVEVTVSAPNMPTGLTATPLSATQVQLTWTDNSNNEFIQRIQRCDGASCVGSDAEITTGKNNTTAFFTVPGANTYSFRIQTENGAGVSGYTADVTTSTALPDAPSNLAAVTFSATQINLTWDDNAAYETSYEVERCQGVACSNFALVTTLGANTVAFNDVGLTTNQTYNYRVRAVNAVGGSTYSATATAATDLPAAPTGLTALAMSADQIDLTWVDASDNETEFLIEFCEGLTCTNFAFLALPASNTTTFQHTGLTPGQSYSYRVQAVGGTGSSPFSDVATTDTDLPASVSGLTATTASGTQINLAWTDNTTNELGFTVERCSGAPCGAYTLLDSVSVNSTSFVDSTAVVDEEYGYRVTAFNNVGQSGGETAVANTYRPAAPSGLLVTTVGATQVDLTWTDGSGNELGFLIERCVGASCVNFDTLAVVGADVVSYQDVGLAPSESFTYRISAFNIAGSSAVNGPLTTTTFVPGTPADLIGQPVSPTQIDISWTDAATNELGFRIERCTGSGCTSFVEVGSVGPDATTFSSTGLVTNTFYRHRVRAYNAAGTSAYVGPLQTGTFAPSPAPSALAALTITSSQVNLSWTDNNTNEAGFVVQRCGTPGCVDFVDLDTVPATVPSGLTAYSDSLIPGGSGTVRYRVKSFNGVGSSSFSSIVTASTVTPDYPPDFQAVAVGQLTASMSWTDVNLNETGYVIERCLGASCTDFAPVDTVDANEQSFFDNTIVGGNVYLYRIYAIGNGRSPYSPADDVSTILPPTPTAFVAVAISNDRVALSWTDNATDEYGYQIERCAGPACTDFVNAGFIGANATAFEDGSAPVGVSLTYRVRALNNAGPSDPSNEVAVETTIPVIPSSLTGVIVSAAQIDLTWINNATDETGVVIERCEGAACTGFAPIDTAAADATSYSDITVTADVVYRYRVRAINGNGSSGPTSLLTMATSVPDAPTGITTLAAGANQTWLQWVDVATNEVNYTVERCSGTGCTDFVLLATLLADTTQYNDLTPDVDTTYVYRVRATNAIGASVGALLELRTYRPQIATGVVASTLSATAIQLDWSVGDAGDATVNTAIERCEGMGCTNFDIVDGVVGDVFTFQNTGLNPGSTYRYQITRSNAFGTLGASVIVEASTDFPLPPDGLAALTVGPNNVSLTWNDNSTNEAFFIIERCDGDPCGASFAVIDSVPAGQSTFSDLTANNDWAYTYRVFARNGAGASDYTPTAGANLFLPAAGTGLAAVPASPASVDLTWDAAANATGYTVQRCDFGSCVFTDVASVGAVTGYTDSTAVYGGAYFYRIRPTNIVANGLESGTVMVEMAEPATPSGLTVEPASPTQVTVNWTPVLARALWFRIERCEGVDCTEFAIVDSVPANTTTFVDGTVTYGSKYEYQITAVNNVGEAAPTASELVLLQEAAAPLGLTATTTGAGQITLAWTDNSDNELAFAIERCTGVGCTDFVQVDAVAANSNGYVNEPLSLNAVYRYQVRALNNVGPSDYSNIDAANTLLPASPTTLNATIVNGARVDLSWVDNSNNEQMFRIERCLGAGCASWVVIDSVPAGVQAYSNTGLTYGVIHNYRVKSANISGESAPTATSVANTTLAPPTAIRATVIDRDEVDIVWSYPVTWNSGYQVLRCLGAACTPVNSAGIVGAGVHTRRDTVPVPGQEYTYSVRALTINGTSNLGNLSGARTPIAMSNAVPVPGLADNSLGERHFVFTVPAGALGVRFRLDAPSGDADMYVKFGETGRVNQTFNDALNCVPYTGATPEICTFDTPAPGDWFVMSQAFQAYTNATLKASLAARYGVVNPTGPGTGMPINYAVAQPLNIAATTSVTHLGLHINSFGTGLPTNTRFGLYSNRNEAGINKPDVLLTQWTMQAQLGFNEIPVAEMDIAPGQYWLVILPENNINVTTESGPLTEWRYVFGTVSYAAGLPGVWPALDNTTSFGVPMMNFHLRGFR